jgi:hypothetical protein
MTRLRLVVAEACDESVTSAVKLKVPVAVGVPERMPLSARVIPAGSVPADTLHAYPLPVPPVAASVAEYDTVTVPPAREVVVMASGEGDEVEEPPPQPCRG